MPEENAPPDVVLTNKTFDALVAAGLVPPARKETVIAKLLSGTASEGDWRLWVYAAQMGGEDEEVEANAQEAN